MIETTPELTPKLNIRDILDGNTSVHYTHQHNIPKMIQKGIYSAKFASRIGDLDFKTNGIAENEVYLLSKLNYAWRKGKPLNETVGVLVNIPAPEGQQTHAVPIRIAPREIIGLCIPDTTVDYDTGNNLSILTDHLLPDEELDKIADRAEQLALAVQNENPELGIIPVYGTSGGIYFPHRMTHQEITAMVD